MTPSYGQLHYVTTKKNSEIEQHRMLTHRIVNGVRMLRHFNENVAGLYAV